MKQTLITKEDLDYVFQLQESVLLHNAMVDLYTLAGKPDKADEHKQTAYEMLSKYIIVRQTLYDTLF